MENSHCSYSYMHLTILSQLARFFVQKSYCHKEQLQDTCINLIISAPPIVSTGYTQLAIVLYHWSITCTYMYVHVLQLYSYIRIQLALACTKPFSYDNMTTIISQLQVYNYILQSMNSVHIQPDIQLIIYSKQLYIQIRCTSDQFLGTATLRDFKIRQVISAFVGKQMKSILM